MVSGGGGVCLCAGGVNDHSILAVSLFAAKLLFPCEVRGLISASLKGQASLIHQSLLLRTGEPGESSVSDICCSPG